MSMFRLWLMALLLAGVVACGGGGDSGEPPLDTDQDGLANIEDSDDDNDGVPDSRDAFPLNELESLDTDGDGIGNNADSDDDGDGYPDQQDQFPLDAAEHLDTDQDGVGNNTDSDDDNDGVEDSEDHFPLDSSEQSDFDLDGIGDNSDADVDGDTIANELDRFPWDPGEYSDTDGDGIGDNGDAYPEDAYPEDGNCSLHGQGNGTACYLTLALANGFEGAHTLQNGELLIPMIASAEIVKYNPVAQQWLSFPINPDKNLLDFTYLESHQKLYAAYDDNSIEAVNHTSDRQLFAQLEQTVSGLFVAGEFLFVSESSYGSLYDINGNQLWRERLNIRSCGVEKLVP